jgi:AP-2 complex subunit mu-1
MMLVHFLHEFKNLLKAYSENNEVSESLVRQNFSLIYELLDEVMDHGYP